MPSSCADGMLGKPKTNLKITDSAALGMAEVSQSMRQVTCNRARQ